MKIAIDIDLHVQNHYNTATVLVKQSFFVNPLSVCVYHLLYLCVLACLYPKCVCLSLCGVYECIPVCLSLSFVCEFIYVGVGVCLPVYIIPAFSI